jgi:hypothetical protein
MTICTHESCNKKATFNFQGLKAEYCTSHKEELMVDVVNKKCITCLQKQPNWNYPGLQSQYCGDCKLESMIQPNFLQFYFRHDHKSIDLMDECDAMR